MSQSLQLAASDRVLVIAPHPDDESIACGGLLLAARAVGAACRVVTLTHGDNNPWPQRWVEKRWRIDAAARSRWGACRQAEAQAALDALGVAEDERVFLGFPDTALTSLLLREANRLVGSLRAQIAGFTPTRVAFPALADRHPDHSATHIAVRLALSGAASTPQLLAYRVHGRSQAETPHLVELDAIQREAKQRAIASHRTQMALSGKRFLAFATQREAYAAAAASPRADHPLTAALRGDRTLELHVRKQNLHGNLQVSILLADARGESNAWQTMFTAHAQPCEVRDARDGRIVATGEWRSDGGAWTFALPLPADAAPRMGFAKLARLHPGLVVFDRYGWQVVDLG